MAAMTEIKAKLRQWRQSLEKEQRWCIMINADPDALASALALRRIMLPRVRLVHIMRINEVTRPDNLAMIRYLNIPVRPWQAESREQYDHFAIVDSQAHHNKAFHDISFSCVIDHHPLPPDDVEQPAHIDMYDIRHDVGATSTIMTQYMQALRMRPGPRMATALMYGIRTDTAAFERSGSEADLRAYQWLLRYANMDLLRRIARSEYLREWLPLFSRAFRSLTDCRGGGAYGSVSEVKSADLLVSIADFFTKVHGLRWIAVSGIVKKVVVVIFRGDGGRDIGRLADACFYDVGEAGGHRTLARAEFPLEAIPPEVKPSEFILQRLQRRKLRPRTAPAATAQDKKETASKK